MTSALNYSAYFQAQLQCRPPAVNKPTAKIKDKITIKYKRTWSKQSND